MPETNEADETKTEPSTRTVPRDAATARLDTWIAGPLAAVLATILFVLVNYLAARNYRRFDWTRQQVFTLSARSREIIRSLHAPVDLYVLLGPREPQYSDVFELAQRYAADSPNIRLHTIDPDRQRDRFLELTRSLGLRVGRTQTADVASEAAIVLVRGDRHWEIARENLAGLGDDMVGEHGHEQREAAAQVTVERAISQGLLRIDQAQSTKVCFATGHGELPLEGGDDSMSLLATELRHDNMTTQSVEVRGTHTIPTDCDALVIAGPRQAYTDTDADLVGRYLRAGGNVLMLLEPVFLERRFVPSGLESVARLGGIELTQTVVIEPDPGHQMPETLPVTFFATEFGDHPITRALRGLEARVLVTTTRGLRRVDGSSVVPESLLRTTGAAWGETGTTDAIRDGALRKDPQDLSGPVHLAMAAQIAEVGRRDPNRAHDAAGRMVVMGWSHLATNEAMSPAFQSRFVNAVLVTSSIGWLTARRDLLEIPARAASNTALAISNEELRHIQLYSILLVPLAAALVGIAVWRARKAQ
jgi:hypothetical protein